ncbi:ADP-ribosylglycohydrolase family protein, partial [Streptomyces althioticus]|uniref:ADP-ribosylglycohydrolase family protein n=1 Tax=Streptomyces althioticus TaxID=83380 RepID=UPI0036A9F838
GGGGGGEGRLTARPPPPGGAAPPPPPGGGGPPRAAVVIGGYPWTDLAPEAVALAFGAYATADGDFEQAVLTAVNMGRDADTTAAVAGALAGATQGVAAVPERWAAAITPARGTCLPAMAGHHVLDIADLLTPETPT